MDKSNVIKLISFSYVTDNMQQRVPVETYRKVYCSVNSTTQSEFFAAGQNGLRAAYVVVMYVAEYHGEQECLLDGNRYHIYRTYRRKGDDIELYLEERAGNGR